MALRHVREGRVELELPEDSRLDRKMGPQRSGGNMVFYNPAAKTSRDLTIVALRALEAPANGWRVLDGLCGSGIRGLRVALEVDHVSEVVLNDGEEQAVALASAQVERLGLKNAKLSCRSLDEALADTTTRFDFIDIDPYGSPARFLTQACIRAANPGYVAATATDVAALCGVFPLACLRRYGAAPLHNEWMKETAARILLGAAARKAGASDRAFEPVVTLAAEHYLRIIFRVSKGAKAANRAMEHLGFVKTDPSAKHAPVEVPLAALMKDDHLLAGPGAVAGPLWLGNLHDPAVLARATLPEWMDASGVLRRFLEVAPGEIGMPAYHYHLDEVARALKASPPTTVEAVERLKELGHRAARTHFDTKAVKTTASPAELVEALAPLARRS